MSRWLRINYCSLYSENTPSAGSALKEDKYIWRGRGGWRRIQPEMCLTRCYLRVTTTPLPSGQENSEGLKPAAELGGRWGLRFARPGREHEPRVPGCGERGATGLLFVEREMVRSLAKRESQPQAGAGKARNGGVGDGAADGDGGGWVRSGSRTGGPSGGRSTRRRWRRRRRSRTRRQRG